MRFLRLLGAGRSALSQSELSGSIGSRGSGWDSAGRPQSNDQSRASSPLAEYTAPPLPLEPEPVFDPRASILPPANLAAEPSGWLQHDAADGSNDMLRADDMDVARVTRRASRVVAERSRRASRLDSVAMVAPLGLLEQRSRRSSRVQGAPAAPSPDLVSAAPSDGEASGEYSDEGEEDEAEDDDDEIDEDDDDEIDEGEDEGKDEDDDDGGGGAGGEGKQEEEQPPVLALAGFGGVGLGRLDLPPALNLTHSRAPSPSSSSSDSSDSSDAGDAFRPLLADQYSIRRAVTAHQRGEREAARKTEAENNGDEETDMAALVDATRHRKITLFRVPGSDQRAIWSLFVAVAAVAAYSLAAAQCGRPDEPVTTAEVLLRVACDVAFAVDVYFRWRHFSYVTAGGGIMHLGKAHQFAHYVSLPLDVAAVAPLDLLVHAFGHVPMSELRVWRLLSVWRVRRLFELPSENKAFAMRRFGRRGHVEPLLLLMGQVAALFLVALVTSASLVLYCGDYTGGARWRDAAVASSQVLLGLGGSMTAPVAERTSCDHHTIAATIVAGAVLRAMIIGVMVAVTLRSRQSAFDLLRQVRHLHALFDERRTPGAISRAFWKVFRAQRYAITEHQVLLSLPPVLRAQMQLQYVPFLREVPFFKSKRSLFVNEVAKLVLHKTYCPGELVFFTDSRATEMVILLTGAVYAYHGRLHRDRNGVPVNPSLSLSRGKFFGDYEVLFNQRFEFNYEAGPDGATSIVVPAATIVWLLQQPRFRSLRREVRHDFPCFQVTQRVGRPDVAQSAASPTTSPVTRYSNLSARAAGAVMSQPVSRLGSPAGSRRGSSRFASPPMTPQGSNPQANGSAGGNNSSGGEDELDLGRRDAAAREVAQFLLKNAMGAAPENAAATAAAIAANAAARAAEEANRYSDAEDGGGGGGGDDQSLGSSSAHGAHGSINDIISPNGIFHMRSLSAASNNGRFAAAAAAAAAAPRGGRSGRSDHHTSSRGQHSRSSISGSVRSRASSIMTPRLNHRRRRTSVVHQSSDGTQSRDAQATAASYDQMRQRRFAAPQRVQRPDPPPAGGVKSWHRNPIDLLAMFESRITCVVLLTVVLWQICIVPFRIVHDGGLFGSRWHWTRAIDIVGEICIAMHLLRLFQLAYVDAPEDNFWRGLRHSLKTVVHDSLHFRTYTQFRYECLLTLFPWDAVAYAGGFWPLLSVVRLYRGLRLARLWVLLEAIFRKVTVAQHPQVYRVRLQVLVMFVGASFWLVCAFAALHSGDVERSWWSMWMTVTSMAWPEPQAGRNGVWGVAVLALGTLFTCWILATAVAAYCEVFATRSCIDFQVRATFGYLKRMHISSYLRKRAAAYFDQHGGLNQSAPAYLQLPDTTLRDVVFADRMRILESSVLMQRSRVSRAAAHALACVLIDHYCVDADVLVDTTLYVSSMYILVSGRIEVRENDLDHELLCLHGQSFAEEALLDSSLDYTARAVARSTCHTLELRKRDFVGLARAYPTFSTALEHEVRRKRLRLRRTRYRAIRGFLGLSQMLEDELKGDSLSAYVQRYRIYVLMLGELDPGGSRHHEWLTLVQSVTALNALWWAYAVAGFPDDGAWPWVVLVLLFLGDLVLVVHELLPMYTTKPGSKLAQILHGSWKVLAVVPWEIFALFVIPATSSLSPLGAVALFRTAKVLRVRTFVSMATRRRVTSSQALRMATQLLQVVATFGLLTHMCACLVRVVAKAGAISAYYRLHADDDSVSTLYVRNVHWTMCQLSGSSCFPDRDSVAEGAPSTELLVVGVLGGLGFAGLICVLVRMHDVVNGEFMIALMFQRRLNEFIRYSETRGLSERVHREVRLFLEELWTRQGGVVDSDAINMLPRDVFRQVASAKLLPVLTRLPVVGDFRQHIQQEVLRHMLMVVFLPGETIYEKGSCASELYVLLEGTVQFVDAGVVVKQSSGCMAFGYHEFFSKQVRLCGARAALRCPCFILAEQSLQQLLADVPSKDLIDPRKWRARMRASTAHTPMTGTSGVNTPVGGKRPGGVPSSLLQSALQSAILEGGGSGSSGTVTPNAVATGRASSRNSARNSRSPRAGTTPSSPTNNAAAYDPDVDGLLGEGDAEDDANDRFVGMIDAYLGRAAPQLELMRRACDPVTVMTTIATGARAEPVRQKAHKLTAQKKLNRFELVLVCGLAVLPAVSTPLQLAYGDRADETLNLGLNLAGDLLLLLTLWLLDVERVLNSVVPELSDYSRRTRDSKETGSSVWSSMKSSRWKHTALSMADISRRVSMSVSRRSRGAAGISLSRRGVTNNDLPEPEFGNANEKDKDKARTRSGNSSRVRSRRVAPLQEAPSPIATTVKATAERRQESAAAAAADLPEHTSLSLAARARNLSPDASTVDYTRREGVTESRRGVTSSRRPPQALHKTRPRMLAPPTRTVSKKGSLLHRLAKLLRVQRFTRYLSWWFGITALPLFPLDWVVALAMGYGQQALVCRLLRLALLIVLPTPLQVLETAMGKWMLHRSRNANILLLSYIALGAKLLLSTALVMHWAACAFLSHAPAGKGMYDQYAWAISRAAETAFTAGTPASDLVFAAGDRLLLVDSALRLIGLTVIVPMMLALITHARWPEGEDHTRRTAARALRRKILKRRVPSSVRSHLRHLLEQWRDRDSPALRIERGIEWLMGLPLPLRNRVVCDLCLFSMSKEVILHNYQRGFVKSVVQGMKPHMALPGEVLTRTGSVCSKIYVVQVGTVRRLLAKTNHGKGKVISTAFGVADDTAFCVDTCELFVLTVEHFCGCVSYFTPASVTIQRKECSPALRRFQHAVRVVINQNRNMRTLATSMDTSEVLSTHTVSRNRLLLDAASLVLVLYNAFSMPFRSAFISDFHFGSKYLGVNLLDLCIDLFFIAEIYGRLRVDRDGSYRRSWWLWIDGWSALPIDLLAIAAGVTVGLDDYRMNKLIRLLRVPQWYTALCDYLYEKRLLTNIGLRRMLALSLIQVVVGHWLACAFYRVGEGEASAGETTWIINDGLAAWDPATGQLDTLEPQAVRYLRSLYWAFVVMVTAGYGDIGPVTTLESLTSILAMYVGVLITTSAIANLTLLVSNLDADAAQFQRTMDNIGRYIQYHNIPAQLSSRIRHYHAYMWAKLQGVNENQFLAELSRPLRQRLTNFAVLNLLNRVTLLSRASTSVRNALMEQGVLVQLVYAPDDVIAWKSQPLDGCYIVSKGDAAAVGPKGEVLTALESGDYFGSASLMLPEAALQRIVAKSFCDLYFLSRANFEKVLAEYSSEEERASLVTMATNELRSAKKRSQLTGARFDAAHMVKGFRRNFLPDTRFRHIWDCVYFVGLVYYGFSLPLYLTSSFHGISAANVAIQSLVDAFFIVDLVLQYRFFAVVYEGFVLLDAERIAERFVQGRSRLALLIDVGTAIPWNLLAFATGDDWPFWFCWLVMPKLLRLNHLFSSLNLVEGYFVAYVRHVSTSVRRMVNLNLMLLFVVHWAGCMWLFVGRLSREMDQDSDWITADQSTHYVDRTDLSGTMGYVRAVYWAMVSMSTVGYGDILATNNIETGVAIIVVLVGGLLLPAVVGGLSSLIGSINVNLLEFRQRMSQVRDFTARKKLPAELHERIIRYYDYLWSRQGGVKDQDILNTLPGSLRQAVAVATNLESLRGVEVLADCDSTIIRGIMTAMYPRIYLPGDHIVVEHDPANCLFVVQRGRISLYPLSENVRYTVLEAFDNFGVESLVPGSRHIATAAADEFCDLLVLERDAFDKVMDAYPEEHDIIVESARELADSRRTKYANVLENLKSGKLVASGALEGTAEETLDESSWRHPESLFRHGWNLALLLVTMYNAWSIPLRIAFPTDPASYAPNYVVDLLWIADVWFNYREFAIVNEGQLLWRREEISEHYRKTNLRIDLVATFPLDILAVAFLGRGAEELAMIMACLRLTKLVRLSRILEYVSKMEHVLQERSVMGRDSVVPLVKLLFGVLLVAHWAACFFFFMARFANGWGSECEGLSNEPSVYTTDDMAHELFPLSEWELCRYEGTWVERQLSLGLLESSTSTASLYLRSLYWALPTLVVVVIGDVRPMSSGESLYCLLWMVVGMTVNAAIIGEIASLVANLETQSAVFEKEADALLSYLHDHRCPRSLYFHTRRYLDWLWHHRQGIDESNIVADLPFRLRADVLRSLRMEHVTGCPLFADLSVRVLEQLVMNLEPSDYSPGDMVVRAGDPADHLYFVHLGAVRVVATHNIVYNVLTPGQFFGEGALFEQSRRRATVQAVEFTELLRLSRSTFNAVFAGYPAELETVRDVFAEIQAANAKSNRAFEKNLHTLGPRSKLRKMLAGAGHVVRRFVTPAVTPGVSRSRLTDSRRSGRSAGSGHSDRSIAGPAGSDDNSDSHRGGSMHSFASPALTPRGRGDSSAARAAKLAQLPLLIAGLRATPTGSRKGSSAAHFGGRSRATSRAVSRGRSRVGSFSHLAAPNKAALQDLRKEANLRPTSTVEVVDEVLSDWRRMWDLLVVVFVLFLAFSVPLRIGFCEDDHEDCLGVLGVEYAVDGLLVVDMLLRLTLWSPLHNDSTPWEWVGDAWTHVTLAFSGETTSSSGVERLEYGRSAIVIDGLASVPWDVLALAGYSSALLRLPHLLRVLRMGSLGQRLAFHLYHYDVRVPAGVSQLVRVGTGFVMLNHWYAVIWFCLHKYAQPLGNTWAVQQGLSTLDPETNTHDLCSKSRVRCFVKAFHLVTDTISSVGAGDQYPVTEGETVWQLVVTVTGACALASIIGCLCAFFQAQNTSGLNAFRAKMDRLRSFMDKRELPAELQTAVVGHHKHQWETKRTLDEDRLMQRLPGPLRRQIAYCVHQSLLRKAPLLRDCLRQTQMLIAIHLAPEFYRRDETIYTQHDIGEEMYFISVGAVSLWHTQPLRNASPERVAVYMFGEHFGVDIMSSRGRVRESTANADSHCHVYTLSVNNLKAIMELMVPTERIQFTTAMLRGAPSSASPSTTAPSSEPATASPAPPDTIKSRRAHLLPPLSAPGSPGRIRLPPLPSS